MLDRKKLGVLVLALPSLELRGGDAGRGGDDWDVSRAQVPARGVMVLMAAVVAGGVLRWFCPGRSGGGFSAWRRKRGRVLAGVGEEEGKVVSRWRCSRYSVLLYKKKRPDGAGCFWLGWSG
jgi:hypothetical protein